MKWTCVACGVTDETPNNHHCNEKVARRIDAGRKRFDDADAGRALRPLLFGNRLEQGFAMLQDDEWIEPEGRHWNQDVCNRRDSE